MAKWSLQVPKGITTGAYYSQLYANYAQMLKGQGVTGDLLSQKLSDYSKVLEQKLYTEPKALQDGHIIATDPKGYGYTSNVHAVKNPSTLSAELETVTQRLNNMQAMFQHQGLNPLTRTILPFGGAIEDIHQQFAQVPQAQYYPITEKGVTKYCIKTPDGKVQVFDTKKAMKHAKKQMQKSGLEFEAKPRVPQNATFTNPGGTTRDFLGNITDNGVSKPIKLKPQPSGSEPIMGTITEDAGSAAEGQPKGVLGGFAEDAGKASGAKAKGFFKSGKGKMAIAGLILAGAAVIFAISKCSSDKKQPAIQSKPEVKPQSKPKPHPKPQQKPVNENIQAVKGSNESRYAELELLAEHKGQADYRPSQQEIVDRMNAILEREGKTIEELDMVNDTLGKNRHSVPPLMIGDEIPVSADLAKLIKEATKELKGAHKDNPRYQVTMTELRAKVKEKLGIV